MNTKRITLEIDIESDKEYYNDDTKFESQPIVLKQLWYHDDNGLRKLQIQIEVFDPADSDNQYEYDTNWGTDMIHKAVTITRRAKPKPDTDAPYAGITNKEIETVMTRVIRREMPSLAADKVYTGKEPDDVMLSPMTQPHTPYMKY